MVLFEIIFCFFTVFGIVQLLALIWEMFFARVPSDCTVVVNVDENTDLKLLSSGLKRQNAKIVFVYENMSEKQLEILEKNFTFANFIMREKLTDEILKLI